MAEIKNNKLEVEERRLNQIIKCCTARMKVAVITIDHIIVSGLNKLSRKMKNIFEKIKYKIL